MVQNPQFLINIRKNINANNPGYGKYYPKAVDLDGVALRDQLDHTGCHLREDTLNDVATVDALVLSHVLGQTSERDRLLLDCLGVVLAITGVVGVDVLTNVD